MVLGFLTVGPGEMAIIAVIALVLFGPEKLPEIGKQIGLAYRELNRLRGDVQRALDIEEYTRFELPDISGPVGQTYTYSPSDYASDGFDASYAIEAGDAVSEDRQALPPPPGPPALMAESATHDTNQEVAALEHPITAESDSSRQGMV